MYLPAKYQPYRSCLCRTCRAVKVGVWDVPRGDFRRQWTRHGWIYAQDRSRTDRRNTPWVLRDTRRQNKEWKRAVHRAFRRHSKDAVRQELAGMDDVSHAFFVSGDYLA